MKMLLDTHAFLWFVWNHPNLSTTARALMTNPQNDLLLSAVSVWEVAVKMSIGKLTLAEPLDVFLTKAIANTAWNVLPLHLHHAAVLSTLPVHHRDPFDRMLVAQAMVESVPFLSGDATLDAYPIQRLW